MDKQEAEQRAQELLDFYGSGNYAYEVIRMPDGRPGVRVSGFVPSIKEVSMPDYRDWNTVRDQSGEDPMELTERNE